MNGDWEAALAQYDTARTNSSDPEVQAAALLGIGRTHYLAGSYQAAIEVLQDLITTYPESAHLAYAHFIQGQTYTAMERPLDAAQSYLNYLTLRPGLVDGYILEMRGDALFAAGDYAGAANDYRAALQTPSLLDKINLQLKLARAYSISGDRETALALYDDVYARSSSHYTRALVDLRKGQTFTALGQYDQAYAAYLDAVNNYPTSYDSYSALLALVEAGVPVDDLNRGIVDYFAGEYGVAITAFDRYLQNNPADPGTAHYYYGLANQALGRYDAAIAEWDKVIDLTADHRFWDRAWEQKGLTQWYYQDQHALAIQTLLGFLTAAPAHSRAPEFLFDAAEVALQAGDLQQAAQLWERVSVEYPNAEQSFRALFLAGLTRYRMEDYPPALSLFQSYLALASDLGDKAAAFFWIAKVQDASGDRAAARATWEQAASVDPTGYYSERALDILLDRDPFTPPQVYDLSYDIDSERRKAEIWLRSAFGLPESTDLSGMGSLAEDAYVKRGSELWLLGLHNLARAEFEQLRQGVREDPVLSYQLTNYLLELGLYRSAALAARQVLDLAGMDDASTMGAPPYFNYIRFGTHFSDLVIPAAQEFNIHPLFLFSVIRQESMFESFAQSSAAASGLMQIMPATGADIARNLGWPPNYSSADLYRPIINVTFGADYLDTQRNYFDGDLYTVLAAYNGGPGNAIQWKKLAPDDPDLFLELISYTETRNYIRGIYEIFSIYRRIYDRSP